jgi:uncharacterized lipoprotein YmbA
MDYTVLVAVSRFETQPGGDVVLDARWGIGGPSGEALVSREAHFSHAGGSPAETAAGLSDLVGQLAAEIASALRTADAGKR